MQIVLILLMPLMYLVSGPAMFLLMMLEMNSFGDIDRAAIFLGSC